MTARIGNVVAVLVVCLAAGTVRGTLTPKYGCWCDPATCINSMYDTLPAGRIRVHLGYVGANDGNPPLPATANPLGADNDFDPSHCYRDFQGDATTFYKFPNLYQFAIDFEETCLNAGVTWTLFGNTLEINSTHLTTEHKCTGLVEESRRRDLKLDYRQVMAGRNVAPNLFYTYAAAHFRGYQEYLHNNTDVWTCYASLATMAKDALNATNYQYYAAWSDVPTSLVRYDDARREMRIRVAPLSVNDYQDWVFGAGAEGRYVDRIRNIDNLDSVLVDSIRLLDALEHTETYIAFTLDYDLYLFTKVEFT